MQKDEAKFAKVSRHLISLIVCLLVLLTLFLLIMLWYNHKINQMQAEEQKLRKDVSVNAFRKNNL